VDADEPGLIAVRKTVDGHEIKVTKDGRIVRCTDCDMHPYQDILRQNPSLAKRLERAKKGLSYETKKARSRAQREFDEVSDELERKLREKKAEASADADAAPAGKDGPPPATKKSKQLKDEQNELFNNDGTFKDAQTQAEYERYLKRKGSRTVRGPAAWKEASDWWRTKSPTARGNQFNRKAVDGGRYPYHEVRLANGKQVDSYNPRKGGGEIISRKAVDLNLVQRSTFESYLDEFLIKYPPGTKITSKKYTPRQVGKVLKGKMILEVPDTPANREAVKYRGFEELAASKNIEIRFASE
jgi:hypothetical protein